VKSVVRHRWELLGIVGMILAGLVVGAYILSNQRLKFPWEDTYRIGVELATAQAITPGQGQTVAVAGVTVGEVASVRLREGRAVVMLDIDRNRLASVHADAKALVRPKTGLQDMAIQLDPGDPKARRLRDGEVIPVSATRPNVNLDEVLAALDTDARDHLRILLSAGADGLRGRGPQLRRVLRASAPTLASARRVAAALNDRDRELRRLVHDLRVLSTAAATKDEDIRRLVDATDATLRTIGEHDAALRASLRALPGTLNDVRGALREARPFARRLGPTLDALRPAAQDVRRVLPRLDPLLADATPAAKRIRRLTKEAIPVARALDPTLTDLRAVTPELTQAFRVLTRVVNELAHNPEGPEEGYLFWTIWFAHNANDLLQIDDAQGATWRGALMLSCSSYATLQQAAPLLAAAAAAPVCPEDATGGGR
jgi:phospholipid/cholesterol/gamma-HCH transport system substrate-binding protein